MHPLFRYARDPLCQIGCLAYAVNRWLLKPLTGPRHAFLHGHFNDLWLVPCLLPFFLWGLRRLRLRDHDRPPTFAEVAGYTVLWSVLFEYVGPHWLHQGYGDPWDVAVYLIGGAVAWLYWQRHALPRLWNARPVAGIAAGVATGAAGSAIPDLPDDAA